jgi:2-polyprenyl-3-methyl-5-hydroxy-6-metoxy-1,4-benzoquinol methylase
VDRAAAIEKARAILAGEPVELLVGEDFNLWPVGPFDCVTCIDVLHHVPPAVQAAFMAAMCQRVGAGGRLIYKDMADKPWPYALFNRFHDLVMARELINYYPIDTARAAILEAGLVVEHEEQFKRGLYWHQLIVARRPLSQ